MKKLSTFSYPIRLCLLLIGLLVSLGAQAQRRATMTANYVLAVPGSQAPRQATVTFEYTGKIETWTVPDRVTSLIVEARGAEGNGPSYAENSLQGKGAFIRGTITVRGNQQLKILVGQQPETVSTGGGGGSFVATSDNDPLIVAGGGGGSGARDNPAKHGQAGNDGGNAGSNAGGKMGNGGSSEGTGDAYSAGGGGFRTDGGNYGRDVVMGGGGASFINGGRGSGGDNIAYNGGFGGGAGGGGGAAGGGGGGYSGGAGGSGANVAGGGGGSYNAGTNQSNIAGANSGNGLVTITYTVPCTAPDVPTIAVTKAAICTGDMTTLSIKGGNLNDATAWKWYSGSCGGLLVGTGTSINVSPTSTTTYYVRGEGGCVTPGTCASQPITVNPLPMVSITAGLADAYCKDAAAVTLAPTGSPMGGSFTIDNTPATQFNPANLAVGNRPVVYTYTDNNGCTNTASKSVRVKAVSPTPTLLTQSGQAYAGGKSNVDVDLNTGNVSLVVGGCTGTINWSGSDNTSGTTSPIVVASTKPGTFVYQATCTSDGCVSQPVSATVKVSAYLTVYHRDVDNNPTNNNIKPQLQLTNQGGGALPLSAITLRYYLTVENGGTLGNSFIDYAQVGNQNVKLQYVSPSQSGGQGYMEYSFTTGAGSLGTGANSGVINSYFAKSDYGSLNELDDYSYAPQRDQVLVNPHITAYYNGVLIAGVEPGTVSTQKVLRALTESKNGASATQIGTYLVINNEGTTPINYSDLRARYYFTAEGSSPLRVELDYAQVGERNVQITTGRLSPADSYVELRFTQGGQLMPGASTGQIRYRVYKSDYSRFDQTNDYSYQEQPRESSSNRRVVLYVGNEKVWGTEPAALSNANSRLATSARSVEPGTDLTMRVLGNPITDQQLRVEVSGAQGQPLHLAVYDLTGRLVVERQIGQAGELESHSLNVSQSAAGVLLLQVSTPTQSRTVKVLKAQ